MDSDPTSFAKVVTYSTWAHATVEEFNACLENDTWEILQQTHMNVVGCTWIFKTKYTSDRAIECYKLAMLVLAIINR